MYQLLPSAFPQVFHTGELRAVAISQIEVEAISQISQISQSEVALALALGDAASAPRSTSAGGAAAPTASTRAAWAGRLSSITPPIVVMATPATSSERDSN